MAMHVAQHLGAFYPCHFFHFDVKASIMALPDARVSSPRVSDDSVYTIKDKDLLFRDM